MRVGMPGQGTGEPEGSHTQFAHNSESYAVDTKKPL